MQGGLEITIELSIVWDEAVKIKTLKVETVKLSDYTDESKEILKDMGVDAEEDDAEAL